MHGVAQSIGFAHARGMGVGDKHLPDSGQAGRALGRGGTTDEPEGQETEGKGEQASGVGHGTFIDPPVPGDKPDLRTRG